MIRFASSNEASLILANTAPMSASARLAKAANANPAPVTVAWNESGAATMTSCPAVADGIAPDTLGLFTGPEFIEEGHVPLPPQIILFLENLWDFAEQEEAIFQEEVQTTYLHELGHYLGLNEDDLFDRGLE
jgi:hypothetical protein